MVDEALPDGWTSAHMYGDRFTVITAPKIGAVTIDWRDRVFRLGVWFHGSTEMDPYTGRAWKQRLVCDAVKKLQEIRS